MYLNMSRAILCQDFSESRPLYIYILVQLFLKIFCTLLYDFKYSYVIEIIYTHIWSQVFLSNINNLYTILWFQVNTSI